MSVQQQNKDYIKNLKGIQVKHQVSASERVRDGRTLFQRTNDRFKEKGDVLFKRIFWAEAAIAIVFPFAFEFAFLLFCLTAMYAVYLGRQRTLPFDRYPRSSGIQDRKRKGKYFDSEGNELSGLLFFGQSLEDNSEIWQSDDDLRRHIVIFGTTGAGKTEALLSIAYGILLCGSGFFFVDAKGTFKLYYQVFNTARMLGREDDLLLLSFLTGNQDVRNATQVKVSNTMNFLSDATHDGGTQMLGSLIPQGSGESKMWVERALSALEVNIGILTYRRDRFKQPISIGKVQDLMILKNLFALWERARAAQDNKDSIDYLPEHLYLPLYQFLSSLGDFKDSEPFEKQTTDVHKQFNYLSMQFTKILGSLSGMYGYIFNTESSEVDLRDVLLNRRIVVGLLPSMAKSPTELQQLGNILVSSSRQMFSSLLGDLTEGKLKDIYEASVTNALAPFLNIWDEWGQIGTPGASTMPAQVRSLGVCMIFAGQDFPAFSKNDPKDAEAIVANSGMQIGMRLKDAKETFEIFAKKMGETDVLVTTGRNFTRGKTSEENSNISYERKSILNYSDFESQLEGMAHFLTGGKLVRGRFLYVAVDMKSEHEVRVNQFLALKLPDLEQINEIRSAYNKAKLNLTSQQFSEKLMEERTNSKQNLSIGKLIAYLGEYERIHEGQNVPSFAAECAAIAHLVYDYKAILDKQTAETRIEAENDSQTLFIKPDDVFQKALNDYEESLKTYAPLAQPMGVSQTVFESNASHIQFMAQKNPEIAHQQMRDTEKLINSEQYPKNNMPEKRPVEYVAVVETLNNNILVDSGVMRLEDTVKSIDDDTTTW